MVPFARKRRPCSTALADISGSAAAIGGRVALGLSYDGSRYHGWQSQPDGKTVQDALEAALAQFAGAPIRTVCAGRTDSGVHAFNQVVHFDSPVRRDILMPRISASLSN